MGLSNEELKKLELFQNLKLDRTQIEAILGRKLLTTEWKQLVPKDYKKIFSPIAIQASKVALRKLKANSVNKFKDIAIQAAKVANRKEKKRAQEHKEKYHFVKSLFKNNKDSYEIHKISDYYNDKYKSRLSQWKISGTVDMFNIHNTMKDLIQRMTEQIPINSKIQVSLQTTHNNSQPHTKLLTLCMVGVNLEDLVGHYPLCIMAPIYLLARLLLLPWRIHTKLLVGV